MAIRVPNLGLGDGKTGDTELKIRQDYNHNFNDQTNAASRLVGTAAGNVMEVGAFGIGSVIAINAGTNPIQNLPSGMYIYPDGSPEIPLGMGGFDTMVINTKRHTWGYGAAFFLPYHTASPNKICLRSYGTNNYNDFYFWTDRNASKDPNGFLKGASPIAEIYSDKMDLNQDAAQQGGITFEKLGVGDYLVKGSLGFAQEGWYIETPKDANGNVLVAVVYKQLGNNDLSIKTYTKRFDDETGDIVPNLLKPRDIPTGRFISLRLHELPKEPPVIPTEPQPEV